MRLICPNCGAQYEVDGTVIPDVGRDVQCSNCGHTWFQRQAQQTAGADEETGSDGDADEAQEIQGTASEEAKAPADPDDGSAPEADATADAADTAPARAALDANVADVLRQEADLEIAQRTPAQTDIDTQPEPGADQVSPASESIFAERTAQLHGTDRETATDDNNRRDLLPDIEQINSTLAATSGADDGAQDGVGAEMRRRSGFRRGFSVAIIIFSVMALVYVFSPAISEAVPQVSDMLAAYVDWVNSLRLAVDSVMQRAVERLTDLLARISGDQAG